jgi:hypothetical protein
LAAFAHLCGLFTEGGARRFGQMSGCALAFCGSGGFLDVFAHRAFAFRWP